VTGAVVTDVDPKASIQLAYQEVRFVQAAFILSSSSAPSVAKQHSNSGRGWVTGREAVIYRGGQLPGAIKRKFSPQSTTWSLDCRADCVPLSKTLLPKSLAA
jgi:hypothetical protein